MKVKVILAFIVAAIFAIAIISALIFAIGIGGTLLTFGMMAVATAGLWSIATLIEEGYL